MLEQDRNMQLIKEQKTTEKAKDNKFIFEVDKKANKTELKKFIEKEYKVDVLKINIINIPKKPRQLRGIRGYKKGFKKAIITLKHGQKIETSKTEKSRQKPR